MTENSLKSPAYVAYTTFQNTVLGLSEKGVLPTHIDHSVLGTMSGSSRHQFLGALRFFELIDDDGIPSEGLKELASSNEQEWNTIFKQLIKKYFSKAQLDALGSGTPNSLRQSFIEANTSQSLIKPAVRFLIKAAQDVELPVGPHIVKGGASKTISSSAPKRIRRKSIPKRRSSKISPATDNQMKPSELLLAKFPEFDPSWNEVQQQSWFKAYQKLLDLTSQTEGGDTDG